ncbi:MAG: hypothetical protein FWE86_02650 [Oscillospiraceae bacterium]|nr:hypothetical protein [Oscillospiraceae bacterium]
MDVAGFGINGEYTGLTDLYFAVWDMIPPYNYIWIDFKGKRLLTGTKKDNEDPVAAIKNNPSGPNADQDDEEDFVELISYDADGNPVVKFEDPDLAEKGRGKKGWIKAKEADINTLLRELQDMDILGWRNQYPSIRDGICWRVDLYGSPGEKHMSGQARFPAEWHRFGKAVAAFAESCGGNT